MRNFVSSLKHYEMAIYLDPNNMEYRMDKAAVYFEIKDYERAIIMYSDATRVGRKNGVDDVTIAM